MDVILLCFAMALLAADVIFLHLRTSAVEGSVKTLWKDSEDLAVTIKATLNKMSNMLLDMTNGKKFQSATGYYEKLPAKTAAKKPVKKGKKK